MRRFLALGLVTAMIGCALVTDLSDLEGGAPADVADVAAQAEASSDAPIDSAPKEAGPTCNGIHGASSVVIDGKYCIDSTEITNEQFQEFLTAVKGNFAPYLPDSGTCNGISPVPGSWGQQPNPYDGGAPLGSAAAGSLNWCSVHAYCAWAGKRMCGAIGDGGGAAFADRNNATISEWFNACSHGDDKLHTWSYGVAFDASACHVDTTFDASLPVSVASYPGCVGGYPGIFDMSGNVSEWTNECYFDDAGCSQKPCCASRSPGIGAPFPSYSECTSGYTEPLGVEEAYAFGGRCCSDFN